MFCRRFRKIKDMNLKRIVSLFVFFSFLFFIVADGQTGNTAKIISHIKVTRELKNKLRDRFRLYVQYQIEKDYKKQFEFIYPKLIASDNCRKFYFNCFADKEDFVKQQQQLDEYWDSIKEVTLVNSQKKLDKKRNQITFTVGIKTDDRNPVYLDVFLYDEQWYFSIFYTIDIQLPSSPIASTGQAIKASSHNSNSSGVSGCL